MYIRYIGGYQLLKRIYTESTLSQEKISFIAEGAGEGSNIKTKYKTMENEKVTLDQAQIVMSKAIRRIEKVIDEGNDAQAMNAGNCLSGLISRYGKLVETVDLEKRLEALETQQKLRRVS